MRTNLFRKHGLGMLQASAFVLLTLFCIQPLGARLIGNWASIGLVWNLSGAQSQLPDWLFALLNQRQDERTLRIVVMYDSAQDDYAAAQNVLRSYVQVASPTHRQLLADWLVNWSLRRAKQGDRTQAIEAMRLLFLFGDDAAAYLQMAKLYRVLGQAEAAELALTTSLRLKPNAAAFMELGMLEAELGIMLAKTDAAKAARFLELAASAFESALRYESAVFVDANYRLGEVYWKLGRPHDSVRAYQQAAERDGGRHIAYLCWMNLGYIYFLWWEGNLDYDLALGYFERAFRAATPGVERAEPLSEIAAIYAARGQTERALSEYRRALVESPDYVPALEAVRRLTEGK